MRRCLEDTPFHLVEASNGTDALRLALELQPAAVLLDLVMPGMTGFEVLECLRAEPATRGIPVIVLTSRLLSVTQRQTLQADVLAILDKHRMGAAEGIEEFKSALLLGVAGRTQAR